MPNKNNKLNSAKRNKKDEFYTRYEDVEKELSHYPNAFCGKTVYCNCDDPHWSAFPRYFLLNFRKLGLKRLISTCWNGLPDNTTPTLFDTPTPTDRTAWKLDVSDCVCSESDFDEFVNTHCEELTGNGSFFSSECVALLKECDIVCTNPPFSLFRKHFQQLVQHEKQFLVIGSQNAITYKEIFPLIKDNKVWLGFELGGGSAYFISPYEDISKAGVHKEGMICVSGVVWFTNLDHEKRHKELSMKEQYSPEKYPRYDNYDAIEVSRTAKIPHDYDGVMGVPISFLDKYNPDQFEIVGMAKRGAGDPALKSKVYTKEDYPNYSDLNAGPTLFDKHGKLYNTFPRILIRRRPDNFTEHPHNAT